MAPERNLHIVMERPTGRDCSDALGLKGAWTDVVRRTNRPLWAGHVDPVVTFARGGLQTDGNTASQKQQMVKAVSRRAALDLL